MNHSILIKWLKSQPKKVVEREPSINQNSIPNKIINSMQKQEKKLMKMKIENKIKSANI